MIPFHAFFHKFNELLELKEFRLDFISEEDGGASFPSSFAIFAAFSRDSI